MILRSYLKISISIFNKHSQARDPGVWGNGRFILRPTFIFNATVSYLLIVFSILYLSMRPFILAVNKKEKLKDIAALFYPYIPSFDYPVLRYSQDSIALYELETLERAVQLILHPF